MSGTGTPIATTSGNTLAALRAQTRVLLASSEDWPDATLDAFIAGAIRFYSHEFPKRWRPASRPTPFRSARPACSASSILPASGSRASWSAPATGLQLPGASGVGLHIHLCYGSQYLALEINSTEGYRYTVWPLLFSSAIEPISWSPVPAIHTNAYLCGVIPGHEW